MGDLFKDAIYLLQIFRIRAYRRVVRSACPFYKSVRYDGTSLAIRTRDFPLHRCASVGNRILCLLYMNDS
jgi:hypothetical protein